MPGFSPPAPSHRRHYCDYHIWVKILIIAYAWTLQNQTGLHEWLMSQLRLEAPQGNRHKPGTSTPQDPYCPVSGLIKYLLLKSFNAPPKKLLFLKTVENHATGLGTRWCFDSGIRGGDSVSHWLCNIPHKYLQGQPKVSGCHIVQDCCSQNAAFLSFSAERSGLDDVSSSQTPILILEHGSLHILDATTRGFER
jgi:hypothetical protein